MTRESVQGVSEEGVPSWKKRLTNSGWGFPGAAAMALLLPGSAFPELVHRMPCTPRRTVHLVLVLFYLLSFVYRVLYFPILLLADILADLSACLDP